MSIDEKKKAAAKAAAQAAAKKKAAAQAAKKSTGDKAAQAKATQRGRDKKEEPEPAKAETIEEKQYLVRFKADTQSHLHVKDTDVCITKCPDKICTIFCPAEIYKWEDIRMHVGYEGCHECGACRIGCPHENIDWVYPKGGHGIIFRLG